MKSYLKLYAYTYAIVSIIVFILALAIYRFYAVNLPIKNLFWGSIFISLLFALSLKVFKETWGNGVLNIIVGYLIILPITFIIRTMYGTVLFRGTFAIYILGLIYAVVYSLVILYGSVKNKKMESKLNELLKEQKDSTEE